MGQAGSHDSHDSHDSHNVGGDNIGGHNIGGNVTIGNISALRAAPLGSCIGGISSTRDSTIVSLVVGASSGSCHLPLGAAPEQLASWNGAERTWVLESRESVTLKPGSLYRLPADREVQYPESTVRETLTLSVAFLYRGSADGAGGAKQRGGQDPPFQFIFTLPDEATLKAAASILKSLSRELTLEELCEGACQSGANRKAEAQRLFQQHKAGGFGWTSENMELFLGGLESAEICKIFRDQCEGPKHQV